MAVKPRTAVLIGVAGVAVAAVVATVAINAARGAGSGDGTVTWWVPDWDYDVATELVAEFEAENEGIEVELVQTTGDTVANRTSVALESGNVPDLITESISRVRTYADNGQLADLSDMFGNDGLPESDFAVGLLDSLSVDGAVYAVPYRWATNALIYNPELLAAAGIGEPPTTFEEFVEDAKALTSGDVVGTAWPMSGDPRDFVLRFLDFAFSAGATVTDAGAPALTEESVQAAVEILGTSVAEGWASPSSFELDNTGIRELFLQGRVAMYPGGVFDVDEALNAGAPVATAGLPGLDGPGTAQGLGWAYIVPEASANQENAKRLVAFLARPENMAAITATFPARISASDDPRFATPERQAFSEQLGERSIPAPTDPRWTAVQQQVYDAISEVALGRVSVEDASSTIMTTVSEALGQ